MRTVLKVAGGILLIVALPAVLLAFRAFAFQPFNIPSSSMEPTLMVGDYIMVSKFSYGYTRYSLPFSPRLSFGRTFPSDPQPGDVAVFRLPKDDSVDYIKRVVGLPGDRVQMINGLLHINGRPVKRERMEDYVETDDLGRATTFQHWQETLPNGASYETLQLTDNGFLSNTSVFEVPPGDFFALGDNRDNSSDSRVPDVGFVPLDKLIGRAQVIFFSEHPERIGMRVR
jgi:signal peptidase I